MLKKIRTNFVTFNGDYHQEPVKSLVAKTFHIFAALVPHVDKT